MTTLEGQIWQFLSRSNIADQPMGSLGAFPATTVGRKIRIESGIIPKPFNIDFAATSGQRPSIGAHQYTDSYLDAYAGMRWPKCVFGKITAEITDGADPESVLESLMWGIQECLYKGLVKHHPVQFMDQVSVGTGYRRVYYAQHQHDIFGQRRPNPTNRYYPIAPGEFTGPGLISITLPDGCTMEFVWSQVIPFPGLTTFDEDKPRFLEILKKIGVHHNSYNELRDAHRSLVSYLTSNEIGDIKAAVRAAASGIDAALRFHCAQYGTTFPATGQFDEKIEAILSSTGMPSYRVVASDDLEQILYLYRARNSQHEGDYSFKDNSEAVVKVDHALAERFVEAAERFVLWLDGLA